MRSKPVPPAPDALETLADAQRAVPLVPGSVEDCCGRLQAAGIAASRDDAAAWLEFLRALGLVAEASQGFHRVRVDPTDVDLAANFRSSVFGAREILEVLEESDQPLDADDVLERFEPHVPTWERQKSPHGWRDVWSRRVQALLGWAALLGLADSRPDGYVLE